MACYTCTLVLSGEVTMQKVKVTRYVSGRRPEYAPSESESSSSEDEEGFVPLGGAEEEEEVVEVGERLVEEEEVQPDMANLHHVDDRRLQRLRERQIDRSGDR